MDEESPQGRSESPGSAIAFGVVAVLVCVALMALFVWQPWSPAPPARPGISTGDAH